MHRNWVAAVGTGMALITLETTHGALLFYGGDMLVYDGTVAATPCPNYQDGLGGATSRIYDDFTVDDPGGWVVNSFFSNNLFGLLYSPSDMTSTLAFYEVRTAMSAEIVAGSEVVHAGSVVAAGTVPATLAKTGRQSIYGGSVQSDEYMVQATLGSPLVLPPGSYWVTVIPVSTGSGGAFALVNPTRGFSGVGTPLTNGNTFLYTAAAAPGTYASVAAFNNLAPGVTMDFSIGVNGSYGSEGGGGGGGGGGGSDVGVGAPEPGTVALGLSALALAVGHGLWQWRRKRG